MNKEIEIPEGYEARIEGNKVILEPKESEDERIRKALIPVVDRLLGTIDFPFTEEQVLNWFRKQKLISDSLKDAGIVVRQDGSIERHTMPYLEKQKEQKPAEWSEEDEKLLDFWLDVIDRNDWRMDENFCKASRDFINWLKSLRPQPKQEWNKEDKKIYDRLVKHYEDLTHCITTADRHIEIREELDFLKSLRPQYKLIDADRIKDVIPPHWKPSEEQMDALETAVDDSLEKDYHKSLLRLEFDLKKLM